MALNEIALADKIAAIMSGNFLPPVSSKGKKKSKVFAIKYVSSSNFMHSEK